MDAENNTENPTEIEEAVSPKPWSKYQWRIDAGESSSDSDSSDEDFCKILNSKLVVEDENEEREKKDTRTYAALDKEYYLPDFESLSLTCLDSLTIKPFGKVQQHYDALLLVKAHPGVPYLDMDSMLFTSEKIPVGKIYELMGLVNDPLYNILFKSSKEAAEFPNGTELFYAPDADNTVTKLLHLQELQNNSKWVSNQDEGLADSDNDEEVEYYQKIRKELEAYESRKRSRHTAETASLPRHPTSGTPRQIAQPRRGNSTSRGNRRGNNNEPYLYGNNNGNYNYNMMPNPFALPPQYPYYAPPGLFNFYPQYPQPPPPPS